MFDFPMTWSWLQLAYIDKVFVRSPSQIAEDDSGAPATAQRSTYAECAAEFGDLWPAMLEEIHDKGSAVLPNSAEHSLC